MVIVTSMPSVAGMLADRMAVCLAGGTLIAFIASLVLRFGSYGSRARYIVWWSALVASSLLLIPPAAISSHSAVTSVTSAPLVLPRAWAIYIFLFWAIGTFVAAMRILFGAHRIRRLRKSCNVLDFDTLAPETREALEQIPSLRSAKLCVSSEVTVPCVLGFFKPVVVIPTQLLNEIAPSDLKQVLLHELAHLKYWDDWANLAQKFLRATLFFHPAAWWIDRQLTLERELACDDFVVRQTGDSKAYARCLAALAEITFARRTVVLVQAALSRAGQTSHRVGRLLHLKAPASERILRPTLSIAGLVLVAGFALRSYSPVLIGFAPDAPQPEVASQVASIAAPKPPMPAVVSPLVHTASVKAASSTHVNLLPKVADTKWRESESTVMPAKFVEPARKPRVLTAKFSAANSQPVAVEQGYFTVVSRQADGVTRVTYWQFTVWRVDPARQTKSTDRKIT